MNLTTFTIQRDPALKEWDVVHTPTGLLAGSWRPHRDAKAKAAALNALVAQHPDLASRNPGREAIDAMLAAVRAPIEEQAK